MGRTKVRADLRRRPHTFALDSDHIALIEAYAEAHDLSKSQALRSLLTLAERQLDSGLRHDIVLKRRDLGAAERAKERVVKATPTCPNCGDDDLFIQYPNGRWRCDNCLAQG